MPDPGDEADEIYCPECGERIQRRAKFCRYCGAANRKHPDGPPAEADRREPVDEQPPADPEPWETEYARRVESRIEDDTDGEEADEDETASHWRKRLPAPARAKDESTLRVVGSAAGMGLAGIVLLILFTIITVNVGAAFGLTTTPMALLGTVLGQYIGFAGLAVWYLARRGFSRADMREYLGIRWPTLREIGLVIAAWLLIFVLLIVVGFAIEAITELLGDGQPDEPDQALDDVISASPAILLAVIVGMFVVVGPCEELLFRGIVQSRLRERLSAVPAILLASGLFASIHVIALAGSAQAVLVGISVLFVTSLVLGAIYEYTQSVVLAALLHAVHNSMVSIIVYVQVTYDLEEGLIAYILAFLP